MQDDRIGRKATKLTPVEGAPGIYRRHVSGCVRKGRCSCSYVVVWRHRGRQHTETFRTLAEAREAQGRRRQPGKRRPTARERFEDYARAWLDSYQGRTSRGLSESTRDGYRHAIEQRARTGSRYLDGNIRRDILEPATTAARLEWVTFHAFRHTCASILFEQGKNIAQVSAWLGHADPAFTLRTYVHLLDAGLGGAIDLSRVNTESTQGLQSHASDTSGSDLDSASESESGERLQEAATA